MVQLQIAITGMTCAHCVARVTKALGAVPGVQVEKVEVGSARVSYSAAQVSPESIIRAVPGLGCEARAPEAA